MPKAPPMPVIAECKDIIVPLNLGTCSKARLVPATNGMPPANPEAQRKTRKSQMSCTYIESTYAAIESAMAGIEVATVRFFLPALFTSKPPISTPTMMKISPEIATRLLWNGASANAYFRKEPANVLLAKKPPTAKVLIRIATADLLVSTSLKPLRKALFCFGRKLIQVWMEQGEI